MGANLDQDLLLKHHVETPRQILFSHLLTESDYRQNNVFFTRP